jgi:hypothetical protein
VVVSRRRHGGRLRPTRQERERIQGKRRRFLPPLPGPLRLSGPAVRVLGGVLGVALAVLVLSQLLGDSGDEDLPAGTPTTPAAAAWKERVEGAVRAAALDMGMREDWVTVYEPGSARGDSVLTVVEFKVPGDLHMEMLNLAITRVVSEAGGEIVQGVERHDARVELEAAFQGYRTHRMVLQRRVAGSIALIIDDFGRTPRGLLQQLAALPIAWTASVIPGEPGAAREAEFLAGRGVPIMIHMPMEPQDSTAWDLGAGAIYADTSSDKVDAAIAAALTQIPQARGLNNHMGSRATTRPVVMRALMASLRQRGLFFVDSVTTAQTVAGREAEHGGVAWTKRDVFLDPQDETGVIDEQMQRAVTRAIQQGTVVLIGHPRPRTLEALQRWIPRVEERGIQFVRVDRLVRRSGRDG